MASTRSGYLALGRETSTAIAVKPAAFVRFKEGEISYKQEVIQNNPIQGNRWLAQSAVLGKVTTAGTYKLDLDPNETPWWLYSAFGKKVSTDISSLTDGSVYKHTLTVDTALPGLSIEHGKGNLTDTTNNRQNYTVERAFGALVDTFTMNASDGIVNLSVGLKAAGLFQRAVVTTNETIESAAKTITAGSWTAGIATLTATSHGYSVGDLVVVASVSPSGYNGGYRVLTVPTGNTFTIAITTNPTSYVSGGTATKQSQIGVDTVEGLAVGDVVNIVELTTPANETATITVLDTIGKQIGFASLTAVSYTVANGAKVELTPQTPSYTIAPRVMSFTHCSFQFGATLAAALTATAENIENWEFQYSNGIEERYGSLRSSPSVVAPKGAKASLKYTKYFENVTDRDRFRAATKRGGVLTITNGEVVSGSDTLQAKYKIQVKMNDVRFIAYDMPTGTDALYAMSIEAACFYDLTDGSAVAIEVTNVKNNTTY